MFLALLMGILIGAAKGSAQDFMVRNWDVDSGLPSTHINAMLRTPDGYLWLGTQHGLVRFDGIRFEVFNTKNTPALTDNRITCMALGQNGIFWAGARGGSIVKYDRGRFSRVVSDKDAKIRWLLKMAVDDKGTVWIGTETHGLACLRGDTIRKFVPTKGSISRGVQQLLFDARRRLWYLTMFGNVGWIEDQCCHQLKVAEPQTGPIEAIALAQDGGLWLAIANQNGLGARLLKFKNGSIVEASNSYPWVQNSRRSIIKSLIEDQAGNLWCGSMGEGVFILHQDGQWQKLSPTRPASQAEVLCMMQSENETMLIGTRTSGLYQAIPEPLSSLHLPVEYNQEIIKTVCVRHNGSVWGGTDGAGLFEWLNSRVFHFGKENGLTGLHVNALLEDSRSNFWVATDSGLFQRANGRFKKAVKSAQETRITLLYEDHEGRVWAGTSSGLIEIGGSSARHNQKSGLPKGQIIALTEDHKGKFWAAVESVGLFQERGARFECWTPKHTSEYLLGRWQNGKRARALIADPDGAIWVATYGYGLFRLQGDSLRRWGWEHDGLPSNHLFALLEDKAGNLWMSSENGIFGYPKKVLLNYKTTNSAPPIPMRLTTAVGLPYKVCSGGGQPTAAKSPDGRLWFPDGPALIAFEPSDVHHNVKTWPPIIEDVRVDGVPIPMSISNLIQVRSGARDFEFQFTSPNILSPNGLRFRYRLVGLNNDWSPEGTERSVRYGQLRPGDYSFEVMTKNNDEAWIGNAAVLHLKIIPRFWETRLFQFAAGMTLLGGVALMVWLRERTRSRRRLTAVERERALERERSRIARDIHDDLGASLTQVALLGDMAGSTLGNPEELRQQTRQISAAASEMTQSLEAIVWAVRPENDTLRSLVEYMSRRTDELFEKASQRYHFDVSTELPGCSVHAEVRHNVFLAYKEALTNVLKHSLSANVRIDVSCDQNHCRIIISDDGKGFEFASLRAGGTGLKNIRTRLHEIGGLAEVETKLGRGTIVRLQFPLRREDKA